MEPRKPITPKQQAALDREGVPPKAQRLLSSRSAGCVLTDIWQPNKNTLDPRDEGSDHRLIADKLVELGFPQWLVIKMTEATANTILAHLPPRKFQGCWRGEDDRPF